MPYEDLAMAQAACRRRSFDRIHQNADFRRKRVGPPIAFTGFMNPKADALKKRAHDFFIRVIEFCRKLPTSTEATMISEQLVASAGSADSNYGAACKGRSRKQFIDKVGLAAEEADESMRWLEAMRDAGLGNRDEVCKLADEAYQLAAIFIASHRTAKQRLAEDERQKKTEKAAARHQRRTDRER